MKQRQIKRQAYLYLPETNVRDGRRTGLHEWGWMNPLRREGRWETHLWTVDLPRTRMLKHAETCLQVLWPHGSDHGKEYSPSSFLTPQNHKISDPHPSTSMSMKCFCSWKTTAAMRIRLIMMQCCGGKEERKKKKRKKIYSEFELNELSIHNILEWNPSNIKGLHRGRMNLWRQYKICVGWG